ncbi:VanZ family protein [Paenibacillus polymyxa]|uniref:VanZ family protein n=1 Tax=Paenibacillus polymyxa TaxID=1406 RepID=A0A8I1LQ47_PAEPO|nr:MULTISPECIES: VanZ family protein [Paenibacillus]KAF6574428.1 VanZ family protein [Paenibacillus sp. EKM206P]KAF6588899.1 VanZ family protein [Paenibacillus sp. EKM205P]MBM0633101.1 VanZ family protein [Paenibacillus polymyxa]
MSRTRLLHHVALVLLILYTGLLLYWMFLGFGRTLRPGPPYSYNIVPFDTIRQYWRAMESFPFRVWGVNLLGNIGVFIPFGILVPIIWVSMRSIGSLLLTIVIALVILEVSQMLLGAGTMDVDDIILNVLGVLCGRIAYVFLRKKLGIAI